MRKTTHKSKRLYGKTRPQRRLSNSGYIHLDSQKYLRFIWQSQTYQFRVLPFDLNTAPRVFTKLPKPVVTFFRIQGIKHLIYLDDFLLVASNPSILHEHTKLVLEFLQNLGFIINFEKSMLTPSPVTEFLGFVISSITMKFYLPQEKITKTSPLCKSLPENNPNSLHLLAQLLGFLEFCRPAIMVDPPSLQTSTKLPYPKGSFEQWVLSRHCALEQTSTERTAVVDCEYSTSQWQPNFPPSSEMVITSDASKVGWGATCGNPAVDQRWLVTPRKSPSYKCTKSGFPSYIQALLLYMRLPWRRPR